MPPRQHLPLQAYRAGSPESITDTPTCPVTHLLCSTAPWPMHLPTRSCAFCSPKRGCAAQRRSCLIQPLAPSSEPAATSISTQHHALPRTPAHATKRSAVPNTAASLCGRAASPGLGSVGWRGGTVGGHARSRQLVGHQRELPVEDVPVPRPLSTSSATCTRRLKSTHAHGHWTGRVHVRSPWCPIGQDRRV